MHAPSFSLSCLARGSACWSASEESRKTSIRLSATRALTTMVMSMGRKDMGKRMRLKRARAVYALAVVSVLPGGR